MIQSKSSLHRRGIFLEPCLHGSLELWDKISGMGLLNQGLCPFYVVVAIAKDLCQNTLLSKCLFIIVNTA